MIENLIYKAIMADSLITDKLSLYNNEPAIFYQQSPNDKDEKWNNKMFPRITYNIDWQSNPERKTSGYMALDIECLNNSVYMPEDIAQPIVDCLSNLFITDDKCTYATIWIRTDAFEDAGMYGGKNSNEPKVIGITMTFEIVAFPKQLTFSPDPVLSMNNFIKEYFKDIVLIGYDDLPQLWKPAEDNVAIYCRLKSETTSARAEFSKSWFSTTISIHVFSSNPVTKQFYLRYLSRVLSLAKEVILDDKSPMFIKEISYDMTIEPLYDGQMMVVGDYVVLYIDPDWSAPPLNHAAFDTYDTVKIDFKKED